MVPPFSRVGRAIAAPAWLSGAQVSTRGGFGHSHSANTARVQRGHADALAGVRLLGFPVVPPE